MQKLYQKSQIWFAVAWIILYVAGASTTDALSLQLGVEKLLTLPFLAVLCVIALLWMRKHGLYRLYGLCRSAVPAAKFLYYIPLVVLCSSNLWYGVTMNLSPLETALYIGSMLCVGFLEELIFRGFLFKAMEKDSLIAAIVVSSVTFGLGHIVNLFNSSGADLRSNLCQVGMAIALGFLFVVLFHRGGSLWPCVIAHCTINILSAFANESRRSGELQILTAVILAVIAIVYTLILLKTLPKNE